MNKGRRVRGPGSGGAFERPTASTTSILKRLWRYLYRFKWLLLLATVLSITGNLLALIGPKLSGYAIDAIKPGAGKVDFQTVFYYAGLMAVMYIVSSALGYALAAMMIRLSRNVVYQMRRDVFNRLTDLPVSFFDTHQTGEVISTISYDIDTINASLSSDLVQMLSSVITVAGSFIMMLTISPRLILIFLFTIPISVLFTRYRSRRVRPLYRKRSLKLGEMNGYVEEMTTGLKTTRAYHRESTFLKRFDVRNEEAVDANYRADSFACITGPTINFISNLSLALISMFGAIIYMAGGMTLGNISSFVLYSRKFSGPINEFANIISELQSSLAAAERVFRLIDAPPEKPDAQNAKTLCDVRGDVSVQDLCFGYEKDIEILKGLSLSAQSGRVIAIVGPTGCGKTTLINLLMRFYEYDEGLITVDGTDIRLATRKSLRGAYSMVLQDTWLFGGTVYENIAYGKENVTMEEVVEAAKAARIHQTILSLPNGYDTVLSDNAANISKGQKQLLTIARAMLLDAPMLILDEATSNVDTQTERRIQKAMLRLMAGRTCFIIAHRLSTIQHADEIIVMRAGEIVERGTHEQLIRLGTVYSEMYNAQFEAS